jgi:hypothetical protein
VSEHLPECPMNLEFAFSVCICKELRACEQRVRMESQAWHYRTGYNSGFADALDASESAVAEALKERMLVADCSPNTMRAPLFAIHALKEKS